MAKLQGMSGTMIRSTAELMRKKLGLSTSKMNEYIDNYTGDMSLGKGANEFAAYVNAQIQKEKDTAAQAEADKAKKKEEAKTTVADMANNLGIGDKVSGNAIDYWAGLIAEGKTPYEIETMLKDTPEYIAAEQAKTVSEGTKTPEEIAKGKEAALPKVQDMATRLGIAESLSDDAIDYMAEQIAGGKSAFEIETALKGLPEYTAAQSKIQQAAGAQEATAARGELGKQLDVSSNKYLTEQALPQVEQAYKRLGGTNRASLTSALATVSGDVAKQREQVLAQAGLQDLATQAGYKREDWLATQNQAYNASINEYNKNLTAWNNSQALANNVAYQKALYPMQQASVRSAQIFQSGQNAIAMKNQDYWMNKQREWALEDQSFQQELVSQQNKANFWGNILGIGTGVAVSKLKLFG